MNSTLALRPSPALVIALAAMVVTTLAAPFDTGALPLPTRGLFWSVLIGLQVGKWRLWPALRPATAGPIAWLVAGLLLLNALLPLELNLLFAALGRDIRVSWGPSFASALVIGAAIGGCIAVLVAAWQRSEAGPVAAPAPAPAITPVAVPSRLAARAGLPDLAGVDAVVAEDHYVRLYLAGGGRPLVLYRFGDALAELAACDGEQVHRGAWVAARAVAGARRDGRGWFLRLADGSELRVSSGRTAAVRARGWLM